MFNTGSKKNNYHRRSNDKRSYSQNSKSYGDNSYRNTLVVFEIEFIYIRDIHNVHRHNFNVK